MDASELRKSDSRKVKRTVLQRLKKRKRPKQTRVLERPAVARERMKIEPHQSKMYSDYALLYDRTFGRIFYDRIRQVIEALRIPSGTQVLELGVGTGTSFPAYPNHCAVIGVDLAPDMLAQARDKIADNGWSHLAVMEMDALDLAFSDNSFDFVTAFHTVTVVPDPIKMLAEAKRVCRPGGKIVIMNHFTTDLPVLSTLTEALDPVTRRLGWRTKLRLEPFLEAADLSVEKIYKFSKLSLDTVIVGSKQKNVSENLNLS